MTRRKYRFPDRATAESELATVEVKLLHTRRYALALMHGKVQWTRRKQGYRVGLFDVNSPSGPRAVIDFRPKGHEYSLTFYRLHDLEWRTRRRMLSIIADEEANALAECMDWAEREARQQEKDALVTA